MSTGVVLVKTSSFECGRSIDLESSGTIENKCTGSLHISLESALITSMKSRRSICLLTRMLTATREQTGHDKSLSCDIWQMEPQLSVSTTHVLFWWLTSIKARNITVLVKTLSDP